MRQQRVIKQVMRRVAITCFFALSPACSEDSRARDAKIQPADTLRAVGVATDAVSPAPQAIPVTQSSSRQVTTVVASPVSSGLEKLMGPAEFIRFFAAPVSDGWRFPTPYHFHEWRLAAGIRGQPRFLTDATGGRKRLQVGRSAPRIVFLIDDLGNARWPLRVLEALPFIVNGAILPHTAHARLSADSILRARGDVLLHLPMQPLSFPGDNPGPGALWVTMPVEVRNKTFHGNWVSVPRAIGFNNHMGSRFTADAEAMGLLAATARSLAPVFVDSRTIPRSIAARQMLAHGIPSLGRTHFLDDNPGEQAVSQRLEEAIAYAKRNGVAVAIGHPNRSTLRVLAKAAPRLASEGVTAVALHDIFGLP